LVDLKEEYISVAAGYPENLLFLSGTSSYVRKNSGGSSQLIIRRHLFEGATQNMGGGTPIISY